MGGHHLLSAGAGLASSRVAILLSERCRVVWHRVATSGRSLMPSLAETPCSSQPPGIPSPGGGYRSHQPELLNVEVLVASL